MACDSLLTTSLLQVVNRIVASCLLKLVIHMLAASCFNILYNRMLFFGRDVFISLFSHFL